MFNKNDFNFSNEEVEILFWIQYRALEETIKGYRVNKISSLMRSKESTHKKETDTKAHKNLWLNEWRLKTVELLQIQKIDIDEILRNCSYSENFIVSANDLQMPLL